MTRNHQLRRSGTQLQKQGALSFQQSRAASEAFLVESRTAGLTFARDMKAASGKLASTTGRSADAMGKALRKEALDWQRLVLKTRDAYIAALKERFDRAERQALSTRDALKPGAMEATVLGSAKGLLDKAQTRVDERLEQSTQPAKPSKPAARKAAKKPRAAKPRPGKAQAKTADAPIRNYDKLTAKDVVTRVQRLSGPQATAVLEYERSRKKRATVIRAVEQRLSVAS